MCCYDGFPGAMPQSQRSAVGMPGSAFAQQSSPQMFAGVHMTLISSASNSANTHYHSRPLKGCRTFVKMLKDQA